MSAQEVRDQLHQSASSYPQHSDMFGFGTLNAHRAVGGMYSTSLNGCKDRDGSCDFFYRLRACTQETFYASHAGGDGPFNYNWSDGSTGTQTTKTLCPTCGRLEEYSIGVSVTDASDGTVISKTGRIEVVSTDPDCACPGCPQ